MFLCVLNLVFVFFFRLVLGGFMLAFVIYINTITITVVYASKFQVLFYTVYVVEGGVEKINIDDFSISQT